MKVVCDGFLSRNPFAHYRISPNIKERQFLTEKELQTMINHQFPKKRLNITRDMFVFGCFTGISFIDIKNLTTDNLEHINGNWWIVAKRKKTGVAFRVKLLDVPLNIIKRYEPFRIDKHLFTFNGSQQTNDTLREIAKECGIEKYLTFHTSRHTFATLALEKGMSIENGATITLSKTISPFHCQSQ